VARKQQQDSDDVPAQEELVPKSNSTESSEVLVEIAKDDDDPNERLGETLLPVSGMVRLTPRELEVISHPAFQRLFEIHQLGQTHLVYRGATHMRGEHAIGTVEAAMLFVDAIYRNRARGTKEASSRWSEAPELSMEEVAFVRLGALLHDIGHLPAGHTLEDELGLLPPHPGAERIELILDQEEWHGRRYEPFAA